MIDRWILGICFEVEIPKTAQEKNFEEHEKHLEAITAIHSGNNAISANTCEAKISARQGNFTLNQRRCVRLVGANYRICLFLTDLAL